MQVKFLTVTLLLLLAIVAHSWIQFKYDVHPHFPKEDEYTCIVTHMYKATSKMDKSPKSGTILYNSLTEAVFGKDSCPFTRVLLLDPVINEF